MGLRILIADDEAIIRMGLRAMLMDLGHVVVGAARDGQQAVEMVREYNPDLAILDIRMPRLDGVDAANMIWADRPIPIVLLTALSDRPTIERARDSAVLAYLTKPVKEADLAPTLAVAQARFAERMALAAEQHSLRDAEMLRDLLDRAKTRLMEEQGMTEPEAFKYIHYASRRERRTMREVAEQILTDASVAPKV